MSTVSAEFRNEIIGYATTPKPRDQDFEALFLHASRQLVLPENVSQPNGQNVTEVSSMQKAVDIMKERALALKTQSFTIVKHPKFQTIALGGGSGLVIMGPTCCFIGGGVGVAIGTAVGVVPALFTLGLSIPVGAFIGGVVGTGVGLAAGTGGGLIVGGTAGHLGHTYRVEIKNGFLHIKTTTGQRVVDLRALFVVLAQRTGSKVLEVADRLDSAHHLAKGQAFELGKNAHGLIVHPKFQVTAASAAGGAAVAGAGGGAAGFVTGGAIGAVVGVLPALFTFGLSIPIGAAIGGGAGLCVGSAAGATAGAVGGGATGYNVHTYRNEIRSGAKSAWASANSYVGVAKAKVAGTFAGKV